MGRVKTLPIKRVTNEIFEKYKDRLTFDYAKNKQFLDTIAETHSKKVRNIIAGYLTRLAKANAANAV